MIDPAAVSRPSTPEGWILQVAYRELDPGTGAIVVAGEIDLASAPQLKAALSELPADVRRLVVDLGGVRHMDSTGIGVLVAYRRRLPEGHLVVLAAPQENVRAVLDLTGLDFPIFDTVEAARDHFRRSADGERPPALSPDAAMVIGLASTALPFADSPVAEAERWLRVLRLHGEAGRALTALGLSEAPLEGAEAGQPRPEPRADSAGDPIVAVIDHARGMATARGAATVGTADLLRGVMAVYGAAFDWVLRARGSDPAEVVERLGRPSALTPA